MKKPRTARPLQKSNASKIEEAPIIHLVNCLIEKAHELGASDIHIEPWEDEVVVRYRVDGVLEEVGQVVLHEAT